MKPLLLLLLASTASADDILAPRIQGDLWQVTGDPDLGSAKGTFRAAI